MERQKETARLYSRRSFLKGLSLGTAGAFVVGALTGRMFFPPSSLQSPPTDLPDDSIFRPASGQSDRWQV